MTAASVPVPGAAAPPPPPEVPPYQRVSWFGYCLLAMYLFLAAGLAAWVIIAIFPHANGATPIVLEFGDLNLFGHTFVTAPRNDQGFLLLALGAGILGSFMHAAQSLAAYVGNREFRRSWILWYVLRPFIGGVLGMLFYFVIRAGLITPTADAVSPYGVVSFGALAGWFSKQATDKLAEVFDTLFGTGKSGKNHQYRDRLGGEARPRIAKLEPASIDPAAVPLAGVVVTLTGDWLTSTTAISVDDRPVAASVAGDNMLKVTVLPSMIHPGAEALIFKAANPAPTDASAGTGPLVSEPASLALAGAVGAGGAAPAPAR
jgi:hypothetical protein